MSFLTFAKAEFAAATARGITQCVVLGSKPDILEPVAAGASIQLFDGVAPETMAMILDKSGFDKLKATLFVWLGGAGAHTAETAMSTLAFIASLPKGSSVLLDYIAERSSLGSRTHSALDALASRINVAGTFKYLIQPQAVAAMLRGLGFRQITDVTKEHGHLVSASV
jgi:O-methyltransferase involved in polyketide biosynthesis